MSNTVNLFETASRNAYRYNHRGVITTEDLWNLSVGQLDSIYKVLNSEVKKAEEESLLQTKSASDTETVNKIEIIKYIVGVKLAEAEASKNAQAKKEQEQKILEIIASKQDEELLGKSVEELKAMLGK